MSTSTATIPYNTDLVSKTLLLVFAILQLIVLHAILFAEYKILIVLGALVGITLILLKPEYGLYISTMIAYSGLAAHLIGGLFLPFVLLTMFAWVVKFLNNKKESLVYAPQNFLFVLLGVMMLLSTFYASSLEDSFNDIYFYLKYTILYFLIINMLDSWKDVRNMMWLLTITGVLMFGYGIYLYLFSGITVSGIRLISLIDDPNSFAIKLIPLVAFSYVLFKTEKIFVLKALSSFALLLVTAAVILTFSRGGILALLLVLSLIAINEIKTLKSFVLVVGLLSLTLPLLLKEIFVFRFSTLSKITGDVSFIQRLKILEGGVAMFLEQPFLGVGVGNFVTHIKDYSKILVGLVAHNSYLHVAAELGVIGLTLFLALFIVTIKSLKNSWKRLKGSRLYYYPLGLLFALSGFMVHSLFLSEQYNIAFFIIVGLSVVIGKSVPSSYVKDAS